MRHPVPPVPLPDTTSEDKARDAASLFDSRWHAAAAPLTSGLSPIALSLAFADWALHLATQPAQAQRLALKAQQDALLVTAQALGDNPAEGLTDPRFRDPAWHAWPYSAAASAWQAAQGWWADATHLRGMSPHHREMTAFFARQWLDMLSPTNSGLANPEVLARTLQRQGGNLVDGLAHAADHWRQRHQLPPLQRPEHPYLPGVDLAITPGKVVHRNHLVELIQYLPQTPTVQAEPVFIVPSWIMKYYILDLQAHNSMVNWLVGQGHTVFILSWRNPDESDALLGLDDYLALGIFDSLAAIRRLIPDTAVHAAGYCLGGTLLSLAVAALSRPGQVARADQLPALQSVTLLASETDFSEPGEMGVLIDESQVTMLEDMMAERGFLTGPQMAGSFAYLHSQDMVWAQRLREFWLGEPHQPNDLMAWNADLTRMPAVMHSEYLRRCYLKNQIAQGRFPVEGKAVSLSDIELPMFVVGTEKDHVSPWPSVYKIHHLADAPITFVLTSGGHNAGIVSEPGHAHRHYAVSTRPANGPWQDPCDWQAQATRVEGSWWPAWHDWLLQQGSGKTVKARAISAKQALCDAPGQYVLQRYND
jgi:polyhydroxyalkanoate synthase subunit PhaC